MEHRKSKRRKYHWYPFFQGKKGHAHLSKKKYKQRMRKEVKSSSHLSSLAGFQSTPGKSSTDATCRHHRHLKSPSHYLPSFWNYHTTSLFGVVIFIFPHSSSPFLEVEGIVLFRPRHDCNTLLFTIIYLRTTFLLLNKVITAG